MWSAPARAHRVPWGETPENCVCFRCMRWSLATVTATSTFGSQSRGASAKWPLSTCEITVERACKPGKWGKAEPNCTETKRATPSQPHMRQRELSLLLSLLHKTVFSFISGESAFMEYSQGICFKQQVVTLGLLTRSLTSRCSWKERSICWMQVELMQIFPIPVTLFLKAKNISDCFLLINC